VRTFDAAADPVLSPVARALTHRYAWHQETEKRAVLAVTELKSGAVPEVEEQHRFQADQEIEGPLPRFLRTDAGADARTRGSMIHRFLQHVDLRASDLAGDFNRLVDRGVFRPEDRGVIDFEGITWFFTTDLGMRITARADAVRREVPFVARLGEAGTPALLRGVVDGVIVESDGLEIFDFKTDRISHADVAGRTDFYRPQVEAYRWALGRIWKAPVKTAHLVFLTPRAIVPVPAADGEPCGL
jgi:ATP-dependent helicase/nuclease subunit A